MDINEARAYLNYLLTLGLRREEAFGPMALDFIRETDFDAVGLLPEEQFSLIMATIQALAAEPKRYTLKLEMLNRARELVDKTTYSDPQLTQQIEKDIKKTTAEVNIYNEAMRPAKTGASQKQRLLSWSFYHNIAPLLPCLKHSLQSDPGVVSDILFDIDLVDHHSL